MEIELGEIQAEFADIIWKNEPVTSRELVAICEKGTELEEIHDIHRSQKTV